ncbi:MAG: hypothetical protein ACKOYJ_09195 [Planctomycetia bacterium]
MASLGSLPTVTQPPAPATSPAFTAIGARLGTVEVGTTQLGYAVRVSGGTPIQVKCSRGYASANNPGGGWAAIGARTAGSGYELIWRNTSGAYAAWSLNTAGGMVSSRLMSASELSQLETQHGVDLNRPGEVG